MREQLKVLPESLVLPIRCQENALTSDERSWLGSGDESTRLHNPRPRAPFPDWP